MIKNIFFDIDDTLFPSTEFSALARKNAINAMIAMGMDKTYEDLETKLVKIIEKKGSNFSSHFNELCRGLKIKEPGKYVAAAVAAYHDTKSSIAPFPKVPLTLLKLKEHGYDLYVASNGNTIKQWDKLIRLGVAHYFKKAFVSEELGREKDERFFKIILQKVNAKPEECLMIGDNEDSDISPAKNLGIKTIRVKAGKHADAPSTACFTIRENEFDKILAKIEMLPTTQE